MSHTSSKVAFKYIQKETRKSQVNKLAITIREATGISKSKAEDIAIAMLRSGRSIEDIARQKNWPVNDQGDIEGPRGSLSFDDAKRFIQD